jgi:hypothetical protein
MNALDGREVNRVDSSFQLDFSTQQSVHGGVVNNERENQPHEQNRYSID